MSTSQKRQRITLAEIVDLFVEELIQDHKPKIRNYLKKFPTRKRLKDLLLSAKTVYLMAHPEKNEPEDEESLANLLEKIQQP